MSYESQTLFVAAIKGAIYELNSPKEAIRKEAQFFFSPEGSFRTMYELISDAPNPDLLAQKIVDEIRPYDTSPEAAKRRTSIGDAIAYRFKEHRPEHEVEVDADFEDEFDRFDEYDEEHQIQQSGSFAPARASEPGM